MRATLIVNPCSHRVTEERRRAVEEELRRAFAELRVVLSERRGHATELAREAKGDAIFAYGGDGLFNEVVNGVGGSIPIGFVPGGTRTFWRGRSACRAIRSRPRRGSRPGALGASRSVE